MDIATVLGIILAWGALIACLLLEGGDAGSVFNLPALILVIVGTLGATLVGARYSTVKTIPALFMTAFVPEDLRPETVIDRMVEFARLARRNGILALDEQATYVRNSFLRKGLELVVDGTPSVVIREIMETEIAGMQERHKEGEAFFSAMGGFSPTLGIIGTVLGLISMLSKLSEPGKMGHAIAAAFIATLYGVSLANLLYLPLAAKLRCRTAEETMLYEMMVEGLLSIQAGDNPRTVESRMLSYLSPSLRRQRSAGIDVYEEGSRAA